MDKRGKNLFILSLAFVLVGVLVFATACSRQKSGKEGLNKGSNSNGRTEKHISAFCGSASKPALEECARVFEKSSGIRVILHFSGSGTMLSQMKMSRRGDIYIPGTPDYMIKAEKEGIVNKDTEKIIAYLVPSILVQRGNPKGIRGLKDLARPGIRVAIGNPDSVCVGLYAVEILSRAGLLNAVSKNIVTLGGSCSKTAALIPMKAVDAIIGWRVFAKWNPRTTEAVPISPRNIPRVAYIPAAVSTFTTDFRSSKAFINFLVRDKARAIFAKWGYLPTENAARRFAPDAHVGGEYKLPQGFVLHVAK